MTENKSGHNITKGPAGRKGKTPTLGLGIVVRPPQVLKKVLCRSESWL